MRAALPGDRVARRRTLRRGSGEGGGYRAGRGGARHAEGAGADEFFAFAKAIEGRMLALQGKGQAAVERWIEAAFKAARVGVPLEPPMVGWMSELREAMGEEAYYTA